MLYAITLQIHKSPNFYENVFSKAIYPFGSGSGLTVVWKKRFYNRETIPFIRISPLAESLHFIIGLDS